MVELFYKYKILSTLFVSVALNTEIESSSNDNIINFLSHFMCQPVAIIFGNSSDPNLISDVSFPKILLNFQSNNVNTSQIILDKRSGYILMVDDFNDLDLALRTLTAIKNWDNRQKYLTIFRNPASKALIQQSFSLMFRYYIYNAVIYYRKQTFYTWYPYSEKGKCGTKIPLEKVKKRNPFVDKIPRVLHGCHVNVTWCNTGVLLMDPFNKSFPGALFLFFNTLARRMNITVTYLKNNTDFMKSQSETGNYDMLEADMRRRNIDLVLYRAVNGDACINIENSIRITQGNVYFLLPPRMKHVRKNYVVNIYGTRLLCGILASLVISCFIWKRLMNKSLVDSLFDTFQLTMQLLLNKTPSTSKCRIFFISLVVFLMCLNIAYQTRLSSVLTIPTYPAKIKTIRQLLLNSNIKIIRGFNNTLRAMYTMEDIQKSLQKKIKIFSRNLKLVDLIEHFIRNRTEAITISDFHLYHFKNPEKLDLIYYDPVGLLVYLMGAKKGFPLMKSINYWIYTIKERGFLSKYIQDSMRLLKKFEYKNPVGQDPFETLNLKHLEGAFVTWFMGMVAASIAFLLEMNGRYCYVRKITFFRRA